MTWRNDKERRREYHRKRYAKLKQNPAWLAAERERVRFAAKKSRVADGSAKANEAVKRYRLKNPEAVRKASAKWKEKNATRMLWAQARRRAEKGNIPFTISIDFVRHLVESTTLCPYVGVPFNTQCEGFSKSPWKASLDRKTPKLGYVEGNVELVSVWWNTAKNEWTPEVMARAVAGLRS